MQHCQCLTHIPACNCFRRLKGKFTCGHPPELQWFTRYIRICHSIYLPYIYYIFTIYAIYLPYLPYICYIFTISAIFAIYQPYLPYICHICHICDILQLCRPAMKRLEKKPTGKTELLISSKKKLIKQWLISDSIISFHNFHWTQVSQGSFLWVLMSNSTRNFTDVTLAGDDYQLNTSSKEETTIKVSCIFMVFGHPDQESPPKKYFTSRMSSW